MLGNKALQLRGLESLGIRAICIGVLLYRLQIELYVMKNQDWSASKENEDVLAWAKGEELLEHATREELGYLDAPLGSWSFEDCSRLIWHAERLGVILWTLSLLDSLPPVDTSLGIELSSLMDFIPLFGDPADLMKNACIRPALEISGMEDMLTTYAFTLSMKPKDLDRASADGTVRQTIRREAEALLKVGMVSKLIDNQLPAFNKPLGDLSKKERGFMIILLEQRIGAIFWATNQIVNWEEIELP